MAQMTHQLAAEIIAELGPVEGKLFVRAYFANTVNRGDPAVRRLEFARFFFADAFAEESPEFHVELFRFYASGRNTGVAAPRGHAKTTVASAEVIYRVVNRLNHFTLVISDTYSQARDIVDNIRGELEDNSLLKWIYGELRTDWHWTSGSFTTSTEVRVTARGSNMKVRGLKFRYWRPDFVLTDDLENDELVANPERREKLMSWFRKALLPAMARKVSQVVVVGTILHEDSLLNNLINGNEGFKGWQRHRYKALQDSGAALWPAMFSLEELRRMRDDPEYEHYMGPIAFAQEMQNEPVDDASRIFKREWLYGTTEKPLTYSLAEKEREWRMLHPELHESKTWAASLNPVLMAVDPAISEKTTADYFAIAVIGVDDKGHIWILDIFQERIGEIADQVAKILEFNEKWHPDRIRIESVAYQAGLAKEVQRQAAAARQNAPVMQVIPDKDKFRRAVIHSANFAGGLVHIRTDMPFFEAFVAQLLSFPKGSHDDMLDAYMHAAEQLVMRLKARTFIGKPRGL